MHLSVAWHYVLRSRSLYTAATHNGRHGTDRHKWRHPLGRGGHGVFDTQYVVFLGIYVTEQRTHALQRRVPPAGVPVTAKREVQAIFPDQDLVDMLVVPTCQQTSVDLVNRGEKVEQVKDYCLERFVEWADAVCSHLSRQGLWCDYIDPCSGLPVRYYQPSLVLSAREQLRTSAWWLQMRNRQYNQPYSEVDGLMVFQKYQVQNAGSCRVILHPSWGSSVYPATLFAKAPARTLQEAIDAANSKVHTDKHSADEVG
jgi:Methylmalonic aciduria and homocystinuria type D protein